MGTQHVGHGEIVAFAQEKLNLPKDMADEYLCRPQIPSAGSGLEFTSDPGQTEDTVASFKPWPLDAPLKD